ncbi:MAG: hypothetical protein LKJ47_04900 [Bifidobacteriaceae bacterium]|jgi:hypothetical protein|nr:hypothetical protein [Bifidobacteriaceae bacterium]
MSQMIDLNKATLLCGKRVTLKAETIQLTDRLAAFEISYDEPDTYSHGFGTTQIQFTFAKYDTIRMPLTEALSIEEAPR